MSKGIDIPIDNLVSQFKSGLWTGLTYKEYYGRIFRNERTVSYPEKISPEIWTSANDYIEVLRDTKQDAQCFFDVEPEQTVESLIYTANVRICFMVNLRKIYPALTRTEATQQVQQDVQEFIRFSKFEITRVISGWRGFVDYDWGENKQSDVDMSPHYLFRFDTALEYTNTNC